MMKNLNIYILFTVFALVTVKSAAQQDPAFTHYMYNMSVINPAYATDEMGILNVGGIYRSQWAGVKGAPETANLFAHTPLTDMIEVGITIVHDEIGNVVKENNIFADFAYVLPVTETSKLSFGVKAGVTLFDTNFSDFELESGGAGTDMAFNENINKAFPNVGVGAFFFGENYYVGLSAPNLLNSKHIEDEDGVRALGSEEVHYFLTGGYVYELNADFQIKPSIMMRAVPNAPLSVDLTTNVRYMEKFEAGLGYRFSESWIGLVNFAITPELRIGYAYEYSYHNLGEFSSGTHEIMMLFDIDLAKKGTNDTDRYF